MPHPARPPSTEPSSGSRRITKALASEFPRHHSRRQPWSPTSWRGRPDGDAATTEPTRHRGRSAALHGLPPQPRRSPLTTPSPDVPKPSSRTSPTFPCGDHQTTPPKSPPPSPPPTTPSGRPIVAADIAIADVSELLLLIAQDRPLHPTVRPFADHFRHPDITVVPLVDLPPSSSALCWLRRADHAPRVCFWQPSRRNSIPELHQLPNLRKCGTASTYT